MNFDFKILTDEVSRDDLFTDKTHEKSADTLFKVISASEKNITIGLEGAWGAGKSTVINMFNQKLQQDKNQKTLFFLFDAWAHKDDPLRKIFLESLIENIKLENSDNQPLDKTHKEIIGRVKTTDTTVHKTVSPLGKRLAFSAMIVPLGTVLIRTVKVEDLGLFLFHNTINWMFCFSLILVLAPILVMVHWFFMGEDQIPEQKGFLIGKKKNWDFFTKESTEVIKQETTEYGEKTSIEFQKYFDEIINIAFKSYNYKQVIIVIDNLDRVDPEQAKSVWSTLQTFFQGRSLTTNSTQNNKIIFVVPYDKEGFSAIWSKGKNESNDDGIASSFLDKCFQVRVEVPQPISSGWLNYCEQCINQALIGWSKEKKLEIKEEYSKVLTSKNIIPTPRQIRSWVNQVGMNGYKWKDSVSPKALALYSYERLNLSEKMLLNELLNSSSQIYKFNNDLNLIYEIAGLLFGVSTERGTEILLKNMIEKCFEDIEKNKGKLKEIVEKHKVVFWLYWDNIKTNIFLKYSTFEDGEINNLTDYVTSELSDYDIKNDLRTIFSIWTGTSEKEWKLNNGWGYADTLNSLISSLGKEDADTEWLKIFVKKLCSHVIGEIDTLSKYTIVELRKLLDLLISYNKPINPVTYNKLNKENWSRWIKLVNESNLIFPEILPNSTEFDNWRETIFNNPTQLLSEDFSLLISSLNIVTEASKWHNFMEKMSNLLGSLNYQQRSLNIDKLYELNYLLICKFDNKKLKDSIKSSIFLQTAQQEDLNLVPSLKYLLALVYDDEIITTTDLIRTEIKEYWSSGDDQKLKETVEFFGKNSNLKLINRMARDSDNKLAQYILAKNYIDVAFTSNSDDFRFIDEVCENIKDEEFKKNYIESLCNNSLIDNQLTNFQESPIVYAECFKLLLSFGTNDVKQKILYVIKNISTALWKEDLREDKKLLNLFEHDLNLDHKFSEAFADWLAFSMLNKDVHQDKVWALFHVIERKILDKQNVYGSLKKIFFENNSIQWSSESVQYVSEFWTDISDIDVQYIINKLNLWMDSKEWEQIEWLTELLDEVSLRSEILESRVKENIENEENPSEVRHMLESLLKKIVVEQVTNNL